MGCFLGNYGSGAGVEGVLLELTDSSSDSDSGLH